MWGTATLVLWTIQDFSPPEVHKRVWLTPYKVNYYKTLLISVTILVTVTVISSGTYKIICVL